MTYPFKDNAFRILKTICQLFLDLCIQCRIGLRTDDSHGTNYILCIYIYSDVVFNKYLKQSEKYRNDLIIHIRTRSVT